MVIRPDAVLRIFAHANRPLDEFVPDGNGLGTFFQVFLSLPVSFANLRCHRYVRQLDAPLKRNRKSNCRTCSIIHFITP